MRKGERDRGRMSTCVGEEGGDEKRGESRGRMSTRVGEEGAGEEGRETGGGGGSTCRPYTVCAVYVGL